MTAKNWRCQWSDKQLEEDLNLARSEAITRVSFSTLANQAELPMKLSPRAMNMYKQALKKTNHSNEPLTTSRFLPCIAEHMTAFTQLRKAVNESHPDARLDEVAVMAAIRAIEGCLTYPATLQRKLLLQQFVSELTKSCTVPNTFQVLERLVDIFVPSMVDPAIENKYISRAMNVILYKLGGGEWKSPQRRLDASRYHLSKSLGKLSVSLDSASDLASADQRQLLAYFSRIKSTRGSDIEGFLLTLLTR